MSIEWPPEIPRNLSRKLAEFTFYSQGVCIWYCKKMVHICGKKAAARDLAAIPDLWQAKRKLIDNEMSVVAPAGGAMLYLEALSRFYQYLDHRVKTQQPEPLTASTRADYERTLTAFATTRIEEGGPMVAEMPIGAVGPDHFGAFARTFAGKSPFTFSRNVAYVQAFFRFCKEENIIPDLPQWGRFMVKPAKQEHRDARLQQRKSFRPAEIRMLWFYARFEEKLWIALGLLGALDNSDITHLTKEVIDRSVGALDYRRRKRGRVPRLIPLPDVIWELLDLYQRPAPADPAYADLFFLTPEGLPLGRVVRSKTGKPHRIDYIAMRWTRLMQRAGIRPKPVSRRDESGKVLRNERGGKRIAFGGTGVADRRGFRSLRTSFSNLAPRGYREEVELIMGHAGGVLLENYLEEYGVSGLRECNQAVWHNAFTDIAEREGRPDEDSQDASGVAATHSSSDLAPATGARRSNSDRSRPAARQHRR